MSRSGKVKKRQLPQQDIIKADPLYRNPLVAKFINTIMHDGKKTVAQKAVYEAFAIIKEKKEDPIKIFETAVNTIGPRMEVKPRRIGGASYQIPTEVRNERRISLAIRWLIEAATKRPNREFHTFSEKLAQELLDASQGLGEATKKRDSMQRMADANRAFAHFRW